MRRLAIGSGIALGVVAIAACATSEEAARSSDDPESPPSIIDAGVEDVVVDSEDAEVDASGPVCNEAGWCKTTLPDADLSLRDIWPLADRAFAIAESNTLGVKVLEWTSADDTWRYIDDNSQNEQVFADFTTKIWAPNADEVYYAVSPGIVFYGRRPVAPGAAWTWSSTRLPDNSTAPVGEREHFRRHSIGVWGMGSDAVYAWYSNTVFRGEKRGVSGVEWVEEYVLDDFDTEREQLSIAGIAGTQGNDLWFAGARWSPTSSGFCRIVVRKTAEGYRRIADAVTSPRCAARDGGALFLGSVTWPTDPQSSGSNRLLLRALEGFAVTQIAEEGESYSVREALIPSRVVSVGYSIGKAASLWRESEDHFWIAGGFNSRNFTSRGTRLWEDGGTYELSSTAFRGVPSEPANRIRGTSANNLWIVGDRYAIHKTTP